MENVGWIFRFCSGKAPDRGQAHNPDPHGDGGCQDRRSVGPYLLSSVAMGTAM